MRFRRLLVSAILVPTVLRVSARADDPAEYEGLALLKRYGARTAAAPECAKTVLAPVPLDLPTSRSDDVVGWLKRTNGTAVVFDFEGPSLGIGNCEPLSHL